MEDREFGKYFGRFLAVGHDPEARKWPGHAWGSIPKTWRPFWTRFGPFSSIWGRTDFLRLEHCDIATSETSETSTLCVETRQMSVLATEEMSAVETGQMSAAETGQMSAVETRQMSTIATGLGPVLILYLCLVSKADICPVSAADICPISTADISISIHH